MTCLGRLSSDGRGVLFITQIIMLVRHELACLKSVKHRVYLIFVIFLLYFRGIVVCLI